VCTIRARSILNAPAWWGSPAGLARRSYAPSLVYQCIGVAIGAHNMQIRVRGLLFLLAGTVYGIRTHTHCAYHTLIIPPIPDTIPPTPRTSHTHHIHTTPHLLTTHNHPTIPNHSHHHTRSCSRKFEMASSLVCASWMHYVLDQVYPIHPKL
jgi:hypothetical protein